MVRFIEDLADFQKVLKDAGDKLVVVDFTATWCGPCQFIGPIFEGLSKEPENANVIFVKVDVDDADDVARSCDVKAMPTFHFYKNGAKVDELVGANKEKLVEKVLALR